MCPECGEKVSDKASLCPHCGYIVNDVGDVFVASSLSRNNKYLKNWKKPILLVLLSLFLVSGIIIGIFFSPIVSLNKEEAVLVSKLNSEIEELPDTVSLKDYETVKKSVDTYNSLSLKQQTKVKDASKLKKYYKEVSKLRVKSVEERINDINEVTLESKYRISSAKASYNRLTNEEKKKVSNYKTLKNSEELYNKLILQNAISLIDSIGNVSLESSDSITKARNAYDSLDDELKTQVSNFEVLENSELEFDNLVINEIEAIIKDIDEVGLEDEEAINNARSLYNSLSKKGKNNFKKLNVLESYEEEIKLLKKEKEEEELKIKTGDVISTKKWNVTYNGTFITDKLLPNNTYGYYSYYYAEDDSIFLDMRFKIKNTDIGTLKINNVVSNLNVVYSDKYTYDNYSLYYSDGDKINKVYSWDALEALDSTTLHVVVKLPREAKSNDESIKITLNIAGEKKIIDYR